MEGRKKVRIDSNVTEISHTHDVSQHHSNTQQLPLIPTHILDEAFQRIFLVSVFVLLQAYKVYDLMLLDTDSGSPIARVSFVVKYSFVDGIFLWFLPVLNVQYLSFSPLVTLLFTLLVNLLNILIVSNINVSVAMTLAAPYWNSLKTNKELTIAGDTINPQVIDVDSRFKGKYTIQYLPDSLAKFNVFDLAAGCQNPEEKAPFHIPIEFNTTTDIGSLEVEYRAPDNHLTVLSFSESDINRLISKDYSHLKKYKNYVKDDYRVFYIEIPAVEPGTYSLRKVRDKRGMSIRYVQKPFLFAYCPSASFLVPTSKSSDNKKLCVSSKLEDISLKLPLLKFSGVPPLTAQIGATVGGKETLIKTEVALESLDTAKFNFTQYFSHQITRNLLEQEILKNPGILSVQQSSTIEFQLLQVRDLLGNTVRYNPQSDLSDLRYHLDLLTKPSLRLIDMDSSRSLLVNGTKGLSFAASKNIGEQLPLTALFKYEGEESYNFTHTFKDIADLRTGVQISKPGTYLLILVSGKYCLCEVQPATVKIGLVEPPSLDIQAEPLVDHCVGMTGYNFKFNAKGRVPFTVEYTVYQNATGSLRPLPGHNGRIKRVLKGDSPNFEFTYKPPGEGSYVITFDSIRDYNYYEVSTLLDRAKHTYSTYFKQRSKVSFFDSANLNKAISLCLGESTKVPVFFSGSFPFVFDYAIVDVKSGKKVVTRSKQKAEISKFEIGSDDITTGGVYEIHLSNIADASGCPVDFNQKEKVQVITRSDIPEVTFATKEQVSHFKVVEGDSLEIPLHLSSSVGSTPNDKVEYEFTSSQDPNDKQRYVSQGSDTLRVSKLGTYRLVGVSNGKCKGVVKDEKTVEVSYYSRPQLSVDAKENKDSSSTEGSLVLAPGCQNCKRGATLKLEGKAPFEVHYEIKYPSGKIEQKSMTTEKYLLDIGLSTTNSGLYEHRFKRIFDSLYTKTKSPDNKFQQKLITYQVFSLPSIGFKSSEVITLCEASLGVADVTIPLKLSGKGPYSVQLSLKGEKLSKTFSIEALSSSSLDLNEALDAKKTPLWKFLKEGEYELLIDAIQDLNECKTLIQGSTIVLNITPAPDIMRHEPHKQYYCVGDHVGYDFKGQAPFSLSYEFKGIKHKANTGREFRRLAAKPGTIHISSLEDSSSGKCMVNVVEGTKKHKDLEIVIHDLPSVEINHGDSVIQDIHEGDMTEMKFTFTGTPPFTVTYARTLDPKSKAKRTKNSKIHKTAEKITEIKTISKIFDYEYTVMVGLEGTYEAIELKDKYCMVKKDFKY